MSLTRLFSSLGVALPGVGPARGRVGEQPRGGQVLQVPLRCALGPPRPEDPARVRLVGVQLGVDEGLQVVLVVRAQVGHGAGRFAVAGADVARSGVSQGAVVACSFAEAVEPLGAVGLCAGPLADDGPLVGTGELGAKTTGGGHMFRGGHGDLTGGEDLVLVSVENHVLIA